MIVTLNEVKERLKISGDAVDTELTRLLEEADAKVKEYTHRDLESASYVEYYNGLGSNKLITRQFPVTAVSKIEYWDGDSWEEVVETTDYDRLQILPEGEGFFLDGYKFAFGTQNYRITYTAGYTSRTMPHVLKKAVKDLCQHYWDYSVLGDNRMGIISKSNSSGSNFSISYEPDVENKILKSIERYATILR